MNKELAEKNIILERSDVWKKTYFSSLQKGYTLEEIEKALKALEMLKSCVSVIHDLKDPYAKDIIVIRITINDLLKEVLL